MTALSQRDTRWKDIKLGTGTLSIGQAGCTITSLAFILKTTPDVVNKRLLEVGGYANTNLVIWEKLSTAFPQIQSVKRVRFYNNEEVASNLPCLVEVDGKRIGAPRHWVVYVGNQQMMDPWFGNFKATNYYPPVGYTIIKLRGDSMNLDKCLSDLTVRDRELEDARRDRGNLYYALRLTDEPSKDYNNKKAVDKVNELFEYWHSLYSELKADTAKGSLAVIAGLRSRITDLGNQLGTFQAEMQNREEQVGRLKGQVTILEKDIKSLNIKINDTLKHLDQFAKEKGDLAIQLAKAEQTIESLKQGSPYPCHTPQWIEFIFKYLKRRIK